MPELTSWYSGPSLLEQIGNGGNNNKKKIYIKAQTACLSFFYNKTKKRDTEI